MRCGTVSVRAVLANMHALLISHKSGMLRKNLVTCQKFLHRKLYLSILLCKLETLADVYIEQNRDNFNFC